MLKDELPEIVTGTVPGPKAKELLDRRNAAVPKALCGSTYPICIARGEGAMIEDLDGNKFLDWIGGVGVLNMGYSRPEVVEAVKEQAGKYFHTIFNVVVHDGYVALAEKFNQTIPCRGDKKKTYFANSGAEADENAIKVAKAYTGRPNVVCFSGAFHGRTNLTMALTAKKAYSLGMGPFPSGIYRADYPYLYRAPKGYTEEEAIKYYIDKIYKLFDESTPASDVACMIIEPIQGEGGFVPAPIEWVKAVRKICDDNGILILYILGRNRSLLGGSSAAFFGSSGLLGRGTAASSRAQYHNEAQGNYHDLAHGLIFPPVFVLLLYSMCPFLFPGLGYIKHQNEGDYHLLFELRFHISYT